GYRRGASYGCTDGGEVLEGTWYQLQVQRSHSRGLSRFWISGCGRSGEHVPGLPRFREGIHSSSQPGRVAFTESGIADFRSVACEEQKQAFTDGRSKRGLTFRKKGPDPIKFARAAF